MNLGLLEGDEKLLLRRLFDLCGAVRRQWTPRFTAFLNEREQAVAEAALSREQGLRLVLFGGYEGAVRRMAAICPDDMEPAPEDFPIVTVAASHQKGERLSHRDALGSLMALGLTRESVGDILPDDGVCRFFLLRTVARVVTDDLCRIGKTGVRCEEAQAPVQATEQEFEELRGTVSSPRLDSLVRLLTNLSRERASALIEAGLVRKNHLTAESVSAAFAPGDIIAVRGYGKYIVDQIGAPTRKGRLPVLARRYR